jgi:hypothetical protein
VHLLLASQPQLSQVTAVSLPPIAMDNCAVARVRIVSVASVNCLFFMFVSYCFPRARLSAR